MPEPMNRFSHSGLAPYRPTGRRLLLATGVAVAVLLGLPIASLLGAAASPSVTLADTGDDEPVPPKVKAAVDKALAWLSKNQYPRRHLPGRRARASALRSRHSL